MKSHVQTVPPSDTFASDRWWHRITFDLEELGNAIQEDSVKSLVRETLRGAFGRHTVFETLVNDVTLTLLSRIAELVRSKGNGPVVLFDKNAYDKAEEIANRNKDIAAHAAYWQGESR